MMRPKTLEDLRKERDAWNAAYPVGTVVAYHPVIDRPEHRIRRTKTSAAIMNDCNVVVFLEGERAAIAIEACRPLLGVLGELRSIRTRALQDDSVTPEQMAALEDAIAVFARKVEARG